MIVSKTLVEGTALTNAAVTYYTSPALTRTRIEKLTLVNYSAGAVTVDLYIIASGGALADRYRIGAKTLSLAINESKDVTDARHMLEAGDFVQAICSANTAVSIRMSGSVIT